MVSSGLKISFFALHVGKMKGFLLVAGCTFVGGCIGALLGVRPFVRETGTVDVFALGYGWDAVMWSTLKWTVGGALIGGTIISLLQ